MGVSPRHYEVWRKSARRTTEKGRPDALPATFQLYVGSDPESGEVDHHRLNRLLSKRHTGYTISWAAGHWRGVSEDCVVVTISDTPAIVLETARQLQLDLNQEAVGLVRVGNGMVMVNGDRYCNHDTAAVHNGVCECGERRSQ